MIADYHIHTKASPDAMGNMEECVKEAKKRGIDEIGFSEHLLLQHPLCRSDPFIQLLPVYVRDFLDFKEKSGIPVKLGVEVDFFPSEVERIKRLIQNYPFDYVIGSVHVIGNWVIDDPSETAEYSRRDALQVYEEYFNLVKRLVGCRLFDILAHPDLVKIFGTRPSNDFSPILVETAEIMEESNICAEINTRGLRRPCQEIYPSEEFLKILHRHGVPIVFGSDAHEPIDVGRDFEEAVKLAKKVGYAHTCIFDRRERMLTKI
jgi:histidinol-phosphatase (PHP family)